MLISAQEKGKTARKANKMATVYVPNRPILYRLSALRRNAGTSVSCQVISQHLASSGQTKDDGGDPDQHRQEEQGDGRPLTQCPAFDSLDESPGREDLGRVG